MSNAMLFQALQEAVKQTVDAGRPTDWLIGVVETVSPLSVRIDQKDIILEDFLALTDAVRDYDVDIGVNHTTENRSGGGGDAEFASHNHDYTGRKKIHIYNNLHVGEAVYLLRQTGGQSYLILSRVFTHSNLSGQWG